MDNSRLGDAIIASLIGQLGALVTAAIAWAKNRDASTRRQHLLDEEIKRLTFWDTWLKIHRSVAVSESELSELQRRVLDEAGAASAIVKEAFERPTHKSPLTGKKPVVSSLLSALFPGFGQFYNADIRKGFIMLAAYVLCASLSSLVPRRYGFAVILPIVLWSTVDAYRVAAARSQG
jgi:TM2 domain-containing membrane protein YozV